MARIELRTRGKFQTVFTGRGRIAHQEWKRLRAVFPRFNFILIWEVAR
jgi:hypothetical protein